MPFCVTMHDTMYVALLPVSQAPSMSLAVPQAMKTGNLRGAAYDNNWECEWLHMMKLEVCEGIYDETGGV